jgi:very-short-patch-repair endonuclease/Fe-S cluster assembly iron-binding protein IscA
MGSADITASPSSNRGVTDFKNFLAYAETGVLHQAATETNKAPDSDFEVSVARELSTHGFECVPQIGVAGFFIDIGVKDPGKTGHYLLGIECDGATYHSAKSARDRDRLRQSILENLGWKIWRIWSTDWYKNPQAEIKKLVEKLNDLKTPIIEEEHVAQEQVAVMLADEEKQEDAQLEVFLENRGCHNLADILEEFNNDVISIEYTDTPSQEKLLRPAMIEALVEYMPTSKWEFLDKIPPYLRQGTSAKEANYLPQIFEIIEQSIVQES